jgi:hypothetical protein
MEAVSVSLCANILSFLSFEERFLFVTQVCSKFNQACCNTLSWNAADGRWFTCRSGSQWLSDMALCMRKRGFRPRSLAVYAEAETSEAYDNPNSGCHLERDAIHRWSDVKWTECFGSSLTSLQIVGQAYYEVADSIKFPDSLLVPHLERLSGAVIPHPYNVDQIVRFGSSLMHLEIQCFRVETTILVDALTRLARECPLLRSLNVAAECVYRNRAFDRRNDTHFSLLLAVWRDMKQLESLCLFLLVRGNSWMDDIEAMQHLLQHDLRRPSLLRGVTLRRISSDTCLLGEVDRGMGVVLRQLRAFHTNLKDVLIG